MKKWIPMGLDARKINNAAAEAELLVKKGLAAEGFDLVILGEENAADAKAVKALGLKAGLAVTMAALEKIDAKNFDYLEVEDASDEQIEALRSQYPEVFLTAVRTDKQAEEHLPSVDAWRVPQKEPVDYFDITRYILDSCHEEDEEHCKHCNEYPAASRDRAAIANMEDALCIPTDLPVLASFDKERMRGILSLYAVLKAPVLLSTPVSEMTDDQIEMLKNKTWKSILNEAGDAGGALRYYDPWHALFLQEKKNGSQIYLILNRCHGNTKTDITDADLELPEGTEFTLEDLYDGVTVQSENGVFDILVETSDHPESPCCRMYRYTPAK